MSFLQLENTKIPFLGKSKAHRKCTFDPRWSVNSPVLIKVSRHKGVKSKASTAETVSYVYLLYVSSRVIPMSQKVVFKSCVIGGH